MAENRTDKVDSGDYSGVEEVGSVGMSARAADMAAVLSSGSNAKAVRDARKAKAKEAEAEEKKKAESGQKQEKKQ